MLILHHDFEAIFSVTRKTHSKVFGVLSKEVSAPGKALFKRFNGQKLKEDEGEKETIARSKCHTNNKKRNEESYFAIIM